MTSLLDSAIKNQIAASFKGKLTKGTFRRLSGTVVDMAGDVVPGGTPTDYACEGIRESFSARYKQQAGIPEEDVAILLIIGLFNPATTISNSDKGALIFLSTPWNRWHKVRSVLEIDPAGASVRFQAYEIPSLT
jgi:hypothetical protein